MESSFLSTLRIVPKSDRREMLQRYVVAELKGILSMDDSDTLPMETSLFDLGMTSLELETLKQQFERTFCCAINSAEMFSNPTARHLVDHFERRLWKDEGRDSKTAQCVETEEHALANGLIEALYGAAGGGPRFEP